MFGSFFFPKIVKIMEIIPKSHFFQKKNNWKFAAVKKKTSPYVVKYIRRKQDYLHLLMSLFDAITFP